MTSNAKIELTDKQIMETQLDAEKDLAERLTKDVNHWKSMYEFEVESSRSVRDQNYHMKMLIKGLI